MGKIIRRLSAKNVLMTSRIRLLAQFTTPVAGRLTVLDGDRTPLCRSSGTVLQTLAWMGARQAGVTSAHKGTPIYPHPMGTLQGYATRYNVHPKKAPRVPSQT